MKNEVFAGITETGAEIYDQPVSVHAGMLAAACPDAARIHAEERQVLPVLFRFFD